MSNRKRTNIILVIALIIIVFAYFGLFNMNTDGGDNGKPAAAAAITTKWEGKWVVLNENAGITSTFIATIEGHQIDIKWNQDSGESEASYWKGTFEDLGSGAYVSYPEDDRMAKRIGLNDSLNFIENNGVLTYTTLEAGSADNWYFTPMGNI
jgi:hypothetical protein